MTRIADDPGYRPGAVPRAGWLTCWTGPRRASSRPPTATVEILSQPGERDAGVIALTAFAVVFADTDPGWIAAQLPADDLAAPLSASFLHALGQRLGRQSGCIDMLTCAAPLPGAPPRELMLVEIDPAQPGCQPPGELPAGGCAPSGSTPTARTPDAPHARIERALGYRDDVRAWQAEGGILALGRGVAGRWETAIEVDPHYRGAGLGSSARVGSHGTWSRTARRSGPRSLRATRPASARSCGPDSGR